MDTILFSVLGTTLILGVLIFLLKKPLAQYFQLFLQKSLEENARILEQRNRELLRDERERLSGQLEQKKEVINELVDKIRLELRNSQEKMHHTEKERIAEFNTLKTVLNEYKII